MVKINKKMAHYPTKNHGRNRQSSWEKVVITCYGTMNLHNEIINGCRDEPDPNMYTVLISMRET